MYGNGAMTPLIGADNGRRECDIRALDECHSRLIDEIVDAYNEGQENEANHGIRPMS